MDVESTPAIPVRLSSLEVIDGGVVPKSENNNHMSALASVSSTKDMFTQKGFIENNVPFTSKSSTHEDSNESDRSSLPLQASPQGSDLENTECNSTEDAQGMNDADGEFTYDIICNIDGAVYIVPCKLSSRLLAPNGILNEVTDTVCLPFPVSAKKLYYFNSKGSSNRRITRFTLTDFTSTQQQTSSDFTLQICVPCRKHFSSLSSLLDHASSEHQLTHPELWSELPANTSAVLYKSQSQSLNLNSMKFEEEMSVESLLSKDSQSERSMSRSSSSPASGLFSPTSQKAVTSGCDEHPDGGIECPKCDLVLSSTRSLGGMLITIYNYCSTTTSVFPCKWFFTTAFV